MSKVPNENFDRDRDAWERAIAMARKTDPAREQQIAEMLKTRDFKEVGKFASHVMQRINLGLRPWVLQPCALWEDVDVVLARGDTGLPRGDYAAAVLLRRLRNAGLSDWEPDPLRALEAAEAAKRPAA